MKKWVDFYEPFFSDEAEATRFVEKYEELHLDSPYHPAKIMMHQTQRLVTLSDDLPKIRPGKESLQLLFMLICAEHVAKIYDHFEGEGKSRAYVRYFFENLLSKEEQDHLKIGIIKWDRKPNTLRETIDTLYDVRCDVVHEGHYWGFSFHDGNTPMLNSEPDVIANMELNHLRSLVVSGCIKAIKSYEYKS